MKNSQDWPWWLGRALQGLTYWIGHRRCLYRNYPLTEGAFVAELCNLIHANLPDKFSLVCEEQYRKRMNRSKRSPQLVERSRVDLAIYKKITLSNGDVKFHPKYIIEVKRASAQKAQIYADLKRLIAVRSVLPKIKTYLVVVAEAQRPKLFVSSKGKSIKKHQTLKGVNGYFKVRRTFKAAHTYTKVERIQYACLVEAYSERLQP